jgi:GWxTD domain-containing protein
VVAGEIYRHDGGSDPSRLVWRVIGSTGEEVQRGEMTVPAGERAAYRMHPEFASLWLDSYTLDVKVAAAGHEARRRYSFQMSSSPGMIEGDSRQSLELVEIIATPEEMRELRDAPATMRKEAWNRFWRRRDPTPDTPENEFRDEFFARVHYTEQHFSVLGPGWRSDRGRIYIQYGPPDQVEESGMNTDGPAYQIWTYQRDGRQFVFVDYDGYGRYELYQPGRS